GVVPRNLTALEGHVAAAAHRSTESVPTHDRVRDPARAAVEEDAVTAAVLEERLVDRAEHRAPGGYAQAVLVVAEDAPLHGQPHGVGLGYEALIPAVDDRVLHEQDPRLVVDPGARAHRERLDRQPAQHQDRKS